MVNLGVIFPPELPPERLKEVALAAEESELDELWLWEDCFAESGIATAAAVLAWTGRLRVGIGLLPVPLRNVALTAMELATLARLFPGRLIPGLGHGVQDWMAQAGARAQSPMTLLTEYATALRALLNGETVSTSGRYVTLDDVTLAWPPQPPPPLLLGAVGPRTLRLAGALGDGVILTGGTTLDELPEIARLVRAGRSDSGREGEPAVVIFVPVADRPPADELARRLNQYAEAGASTVALLSVGDHAPALPEFVRYVGREVRPLLG